MAEFDYEYTKEEIKQALLSVKRKGMKELVDFLEKTDYYIAPASSKYHLSEPFGLMIHQYSVYNILLEKNKMFNLRINQDTIILTALLHDICKVGLYRKVADQYITNKEVSKRGHGKLSLERIKRFITLTPEEEAIIKYHMGTFAIIGVGYLEEYTAQEMHEAIKKFPTVQIFASCDMESTVMEQNQIKTEEKTALTTKNILQIVEEEDTGMGIQIETVINRFTNTKQAEEILNKMKLQGDVFEPRHGFIKILK